MLYCRFFVVAGRQFCDNKGLKVKRICWSFIAFSKQFPEHVEMK